MGLLETMGPVPVGLPQAAVPEGPLEDAEMAPVLNCEAVVLLVKNGKPEEPVPEGGTMTVIVTMGWVVDGTDAPDEVALLEAEDAVMPEA